ncbi:DUF2459 domain-containing protein [Mesonia aquimarina]|uniref:DUF2459 domain-containing protein n=1 Tax=Mesonia aquimarina TaxID=1504967 RepID=UPI0013CE67A5|nr:DUF2459 domain-containing protein [Mesonia aquimarina]
MYLHTNGVHLDIIIPKKNASEKLLQDLALDETDAFLSFGWGDKNFYLNTPEWSDLTFNNATKALFLKSATWIHLTKYQHKRSDWTPVYLNNAQLKKLNTYILNSFYLDKNQQKVLLQGKGYTDIDDFYEATGSYHCFFTCNTWVNQAFIESDLKACLWTPFDFALIDKYTD